MTSRRPPSLNSYMKKAIKSAERLNRTLGEFIPIVQEATRVVADLSAHLKTLPDWIARK